MFLGIDHGYKSVRFYIEPIGDFFEYNRKEILRIDFMKKLENYNIKIAAIAYSMGDGIDKIIDTRYVKNRGLLEQTVGDYIGGGTRVYDEVTKRYLTYQIPGMHKNLKVLDKRFRVLFSHMAASDKVALSYYCFKKYKKKNMIISDISSNIVTVAIKDSKLFGGIDACILSRGLYHGVLDLEEIRRIDKSVIKAGEAFYRSGLIYRLNLSEDEFFKNSFAMECLKLSALLQIFAMYNIIEPDIIVLAGSAIEKESFRNLILKDLEKFCEIRTENNKVQAIGASYIARDIYTGIRSILGIEVFPSSPSSIQ